MSLYAKQAVITAAAADESIKAKLLGAEAEQTLVEILTLTDAEKQEVMELLQKEPSSEVTETPVDDLNNPSGPGVGGRLFA